MLVDKATLNLNTGTWSHCANLTIHFEANAITIKKLDELIDEIKVGPWKTDLRLKETKNLIEKFNLDDENRPNCKQQHIVYKSYEERSIYCDVCLSNIDI